MNAITNFFSNLFGPVVNVLGQVLLFFYNTLDPVLANPWWLSIAALTVVVRTLLFPLTIKQVKSMRAMQDLKPDMDRIRNQYQGNRPKQQEETMKLYQERGVNPLGGCLPVLVQMPVFIGMFYVIRQFGGYKVGDRVVPPQYDSFHDGGILWFQNLSQADPYHILPILSAVTMLAATEITAKNIDPQQRWIMRLLPIGVTVFLWSFPAGLFVYWITSNLVTLVQNYVIYHHGPGKKPSGADSSIAETKKGTPVGESDPLPGRNGSEQQTGPQPEDAESRAAKVAKRKRRKKKK
ncbi:MAG: membrane protein insertase YidC [Rubrobacter sp.]|nr:membrane protein insertase YidC [Rubrobacter sp.]